MNANAAPIASDKSRKELDDITRTIIGCAFKVSTALGPDFLERIYENALCRELRDAGLTVEQQRPVGVWYREELVGEYFTDIIVESAVVVELKSVERIAEQHAAQCVHYLRATGYRVCLLLNFGRPRLEVRRFVRRY